MNRAQRRAAGKTKHRLTQWPKYKPLPLPISLGDDQKVWTCSCESGWLSITNDRPSEAHQAHVLEARGVKADV